MGEFKIPVSHDKPPMFDQMVARFPIGDGNVRPIFAYAPYIYNPFYVPIPPAMSAHEKVHIGRQGNDPAGWWRQYIDSDEFRLAEEILAHVIEYHVLADRKPAGIRRLVFAALVDRLRHPMYGYQPPIPEYRARSLLRWALEHEEDNGAHPEEHVK